MAKCIICDKEFEAKRSDAQLCSARCRQRAKRSGIMLRGDTVRFKGTSPLPPTECTPGKLPAVTGALGMPVQPTERQPKFDGISRITKVSKEEMDKKVAEGIARVKLGMAQKGESDTFMGHEIPKGLKGIDLTIWKSEIKEISQ